MNVLLGKTPGMQRNVAAVDYREAGSSIPRVFVEDAVQRVLQLPAVAAKNFLITIGDRTVTGLVARDPFVGPWQVGVADVAVTCSGFQGYTGEAMAIGERPPVALLSGPASGRLAVGEAITNILAASVADLADIKLSANWMAAAGHPGADAELYATVDAVARKLCPALNIAIPVGKDSLSMKSVWTDPSGQKVRDSTFVIDYLGICTGHRCAPDADSGDRYENGRQPAAVGRSWQIPKPPGRVGFLPGVLTAR